MRIKVVLLVAGLALSTIALAEELTDAKKASIKELMDITGSAQRGEMFAAVFLEQMTMAMKSINPEIPPEAFTIMEEEINAVIKEEMLEKESLYELIYPIYHKYLTLEDTRAFIAFYNTPVGRKTIRVMPQLTQEAMQAGRLWGHSMQTFLDTPFIDFVHPDDKAPTMEAIGNAEITRGQVVLQTCILPNDLVEVTVADNGPGINAATVNTIFDPLQTNKKTGMGIGLSLSRTIIEAHGGKLWVDKDYRHGALFGFELPVSK